MDEELFAKVANAAMAVIVWAIAIAALLGAVAGVYALAQWMM